MRLLVVSVALCKGSCYYNSTFTVSIKIFLYLLQDFRNYRYSLPMVPGLTVDLEAQRTCIKIPTTGYNEVAPSLCMPHG